MKPGRLLHADEGTSLVLALVFLSLFGLFVTTILTFADTGVRTTMSLRDHDGRLYAADGAMDGALLYVREDAARGREGEPCPDFTMTTTNDTPVVVECEPQPGSGEVLPGGGDSSQNKPRNAVLTLSQSAAEEGIFVQNNINPAVPFNIVGNVRSNSTITVASGDVAVEGNVTATGACSGTITATVTKSCSTGTTVVDPGDGNSGYDPKVTTRPLDVTVPSCTPAGLPVVMPPGTYTDAGALNTLMASCNRTFVFQGVYYFHFSDSDNVACGSTSGEHIWCVNNGSGDFNIIGGTPDPTTAGECLPEGPGTQFIFGGDSRVSFQAGKARICAYPETARQRIAIYAKAGPQLPPPPDETFDPVDVVLEAGSTTTNKGNPKFTNPGRAQSIDDSVATATLKKSQEATLTLGDFAPTIPDDATVDPDKVSLVVRHREPPIGRVDTMTVDITNGLGAALPTVTAGSGATCSAPDMLCLTDALRTNRLAIARNDFDEPDEINGATVRVLYRARSDNGDDLEAQVDAVVFEVTYTPAPVPQPAPEPFPSQTGCVTQEGLAAITGCALVTTDGSNTDVRILGTVYTPRSAVYLKAVNKGSQILGRGLISRVLRVELPGSTGLNEAPIQIPPDSGGGHANRNVIFTARIDGEAKLRARAEYDDSQNPPSVTVKSWAVLR